MKKNNDYTKVDFVNAWNESKNNITRMNINCNQYGCPRYVISFMDFLPKAKDGERSLDYDQVAYYLRKFFPSLFFRKYNTREIGGGFCFSNYYSGIDYIDYIINKK